MTDIITYRLLTRSEIVKLQQIERSENIHHLYFMRDGVMVLEPYEVEVPEWSAEEKQRRIAGLQAVFDQGATFFGAFTGEELAGMSVLDHNPVRTGQDRLNPEGFWVSQQYRQKGGGNTLFSLAAEEARQRSALALYVSATPSQNTVHFYQHLGCRQANPVDPFLLTKEPEDIHLELIL